MVMDDLDWSARCVQDGNHIGQPLISTANGSLWLNWYWSSQNKSALNLNSTLAAIFQGTPIGDKTWILTNIDGTSQCRRTLFAAYQKPAVFSTTVDATANSGNSIPALLSTGTPPFCQTVYIDPLAVANSTQVYISSISLYNKSRPNQYVNQSGIQSPGMTLYVVPTKNGVPNFGLITNYPFARKEYIEITPSLDGSLSTTFTFDKNVLVNTGETYGFVVVADGNDPGYIWWEAVVGQIDVVTGSKITNLGNQFNGEFFDLTSSASSWQSVSGIALKFDLNVSRYFVQGVAINNNSQTFDLHIGKYEFVNYDVIGSIGQPWGGEWLYMPNPNPDGTCSVTAGNNQITANGANWSTWFVSNTEPNLLVVTNGIWTDVRRVFPSTANGNVITANSPFSFSASNASFFATAPLAIAYLDEASRDERGVKNRILLANSTANSQVFLSNGGYLVGTISGCYLANLVIENVIVAEVDPQIYIDNPSATSYTVQDQFSYTTTTNAISVSSLAQSSNVQMFGENIFQAGPAKVLMSRSNEVQLASPSYAGDPANSSVLQIVVSSDHDYQAATISGRQNHVYYTRYFINDDHTNEHTTHGNAISKAVSSKVSLANGQFAEDLLVYTQIYRPPGTDILVYGKLWNSADSDSFTDKDWTALTCTVNPNVYSSATDLTDEIEQTWDLKLYPASQYSFGATVTTVSNQTNVTATAAVFTGANVAVGDLVKIYQPLFPNTDYQICSIVNVVSTTVITVDTPISNAGVIGAGLAIDLIKNPQQAFRNILNQNVVRYYATSTGAYFDTFNAFAVKVVFQSNNMAVIPYVSSIRAIAVSA